MKIKNYFNRCIIFLVILMCLIVFNCDIASAGYEKNLSIEKGQTYNITLTSATNTVPVLVSNDENVAIGKIIGWSSVVDTNGLRFEFKVSITSVNVGFTNIWITRDSQVVGVFNVDVTARALTNDNIILDTTSYIHTGEEIKPQPKVYYKGTLLTKGKDYVITYENNIEIGEGKLIVNGIGDYVGTIEKTFSIAEKIVSDVTIDDSSFLYTGSEIKPIIKAYSNGELLEENIDYIVTYENNIEMGTAKVTVTGIGKCKGSITKTFTIYKKNITQVILEETSFLYTGKEIRPSVKVYSDKELLEEGKQYKLTYTNNIEVGTSEAIVEGIGAYTGKITKSFKINKRQFGRIYIDGPNYYTGKEVMPVVSIYTIDDELLVEGIDYNLDYMDNIEVGTGKVIVTGIALYKHMGSVTYYFQIEKKIISRIVIEKNSYDYSGVEIKPVPIVYFGDKILEKDVDYSISYENNNEVGIGKVIVTGIGVCEGNKNVSYEIRGNINNAYIITYDCYYRDIFEDTLKYPDIYFYGKKLEYLKDYYIEYDSKYVDVGTGYVTIFGQGGYYGSIRKSYKIMPKVINSNNVRVVNEKVPIIGCDLKYGPGVEVALYVSGKNDDWYSKGLWLEEGADYTISLRNNTKMGTATVIVKGINNYTGVVEKNYQIVPLDLSAYGQLFVDGVQFYYTGKEIKPKVVLYDSFSINELVLNKDYKITYINNKYPGTASLTITGIGYYTGKQTKKFNIKPPSLAAISNVSANLYGYDDVKISWKKVSKANGYNVYYKKSSSSKYTKIAYTTNLYIKKDNLSDGIKYTFKVVPCVKINGKVYESGKSKTSSITTLKKIATPKVTKSGTGKVKISWTNIGGETGYQISKSTKKNKTSIAVTYKTTSCKSKVIKATRKKTYYYKVRAYKIVNGKKIYGPWSNVKSYKLK